MRKSITLRIALSLFILGLSSACVTVETVSEAEAATTLTETETNPAKPNERLLDHDEKMDCTSQVFSAGSKPLCK